MAIPAYMKIDGIPGSVNVSGREGFVEVLEFNHRVYVPTDRDDGSLTGTRKHDSLVLHKALTNRPRSLPKGLHGANGPRHLYSGVQNHRSRRGGCIF